MVKNHIHSIEIKDWNNDFILKPTDSQSIYNFENVFKNYTTLSTTFSIIIQDSTGATFPERITDMGITQNWYLALDCLGCSLYSPSVLFASISVECVLNHDTRLEKFRQDQKREWLDLNWKNLEDAHFQGLPTKLLLNDGEIFAKDSIEFVNRRNKVAHGDSEGYHKIHAPKKIEIGVKYTNYWQPIREHALEQINKARNFIIEWAKQQPEVRLH